jgi:hypothetical protein
MIWKVRWGKLRYCAFVPKAEVRKKTVKGTKIIARIIFGCTREK